jgi:hypothetical protein
MKKLLVALAFTATFSACTENETTAPVVPSTPPIVDTTGVDILDLAAGSYVTYLLTGNVVTDSNFINFEVSPAGYEMLVFEVALGQVVDTLISIEGTNFGFVCTTALQPDITGTYEVVEDQFTFVQDSTNRAVYSRVK